MLLFKVSLLLLLVASTVRCASAAVSSSWQVANFTGSVERVSTQDGYDETDFYYPVVDPEEPVNFPFIVFLSGGLVDKSLYSNFAFALASYGYIVVIPNHQQTIVPNMPPNLWASQLTPSDVLLDLTVRSQTSSSPLFEIVDTTRGGLSGHSNGGGAVLFASSSQCQIPFCFGPVFERPDAFRATVAISTHLIPQGGPPGANIDEPVNVDNEIPVALINGELDSMGDVCKSWPLVEEEKDMIIVEGTNHWAVTNIQDPPGNTPDEFPQTRSQEWSNQMFAKWTAIVFDAYLKQDLPAFDPEDVDEGVSINEHCQSDQETEALSTPTTSNSELSTALIVGIVIVFVIFGIMLVAVGAYCFYQRSRSSTKADSLDEASPAEKPTLEPTENIAEETLNEPQFVDM